MECLLLDTATIAERSVWAMDFSEVLVIDKADFLDLRKLYPQFDHHIKILQNSSRGLLIREKMNSRQAFITRNSKNPD